jgi:hypothetical protein
MSAGAAHRGQRGEAARAVAEVVNANPSSELIVLLDECSKIRKAEHYDEHDQQADCAELHYYNQVRLARRCGLPGPFECGRFCTQFGRHWNFPQSSPSKNARKRDSSL